MKSIINRDGLKEIAPRAEERLLQLAPDGSPVEFVASYILTWASLLFTNWRSGPIKPNRSYPGLPNLEMLANNAIKMISIHVNKILRLWADGGINLQLETKPLTDMEILALQCEGRRCVTCIMPPHSLSEYVLNERDPLSFCLHDLMHAHHFYSRPEWLNAQIGFARAIREALDKGIFTGLFADPRFLGRLHYVYSDMNAHPLHLLKTLRAIIDGAKDCGLNGDRVWNEFIEIHRAHDLRAEGLSWINREESKERVLKLHSWLSDLGGARQSAGAQGLRDSAAF